MVRRNAVLVVMCLALVVVVGMMASLMVAVPDLAADLRASEAELLWVVNAYGVTFAGLLLFAGSLGDRLGRRAVLVGGLLVFGLASTLVLAVDDVEAIIALRAIAGVGAAAVMPMTLAVITHVFPPEERGRAVGVWSGVTVGGALIGLLSAGALLEVYSWRSIFVLNVALTAVALVGSSIVPRQRRSEAARLDAGGGPLSVVAVASAVFALVEGPERGWGSALVVAGFVVAAVAGVALVVWELRHPHPLLDPRLFRRPGLASGSLVITAESLAMFGFFFVGLQYLQVIRGYSPLVAALALFPLALGAMVFSPLVPRLSARAGYLPVVVAGMVMIGAGLLTMSRLAADSGYLQLGVGTLLMGSGIAFAATPATEAIMASLPADRQGVASALNDVTRELGGVLGIALLGSIFNATYRDRIADATASLPPDAAASATDSVAAAVALASAPGAPPGLLDRVRDGFMDGLTGGTLAGAIVVAAGTAAAVAVEVRRRR